MKGFFHSPGFPQWFPWVKCSKWISEQKININIMYNKKNKYIGYISKYVLTYKIFSSSWLNILNFHSLIHFSYLNLWNHYVFSGEWKYRSFTRFVHFSRIPKWLRMVTPGEQKQPEWTKIAQVNEKTRYLYDWFTRKNFYFVEKQPKVNEKHDICTI